MVMVSLGGLAVRTGDGRAVDVCLSAGPARALHRRRCAGDPMGCAGPCRLAPRCWPAPLRRRWLHRRGPGCRRPGHELRSRCRRVGRDQRLLRPARWRLCPPACAAVSDSVGSSVPRQALGRLRSVQDRRSEPEPAPHPAPAAPFQAILPRKSASSDTRPWTASCAAMVAWPCRHRRRAFRRVSACFVAGFERAHSIHCPAMNQPHAQRLLVVDDDHALRSLLADYLAARRMQAPPGHSCASCLLMAL